WRDRTFQALALTVLFLVLYLCLVHALTFLPLIPGVHVDEATITTWQGWLEPYLALQQVLAPPEHIQGLTPAEGYAAVMLGVTLLLNAWGLWKLRVWNPSGEPIIQPDAAAL